MIQIVCGEKDCGLPTKVYIRAFAVLSEPNAISYTMKALGGLEAKCPAGHRLEKPDTEKSIRKVYENVETPL
jgi:hypothetical protein